MAPWIDSDVARASGIARHLENGDPVRLPPFPRIEGAQLQEIPTVGAESRVSGTHPVYFLLEACIALY